MGPRVIEPGARLGEWVLEAPLGKGGFAEVWRARHNAFPERRVAVKVPFDRDYAARLRTEGLIQNRVEHPRIVRTLGLDPDHDPPYLVVELVDGESLRALLERGRLPAPEALRIAREILVGLDAAHRAGIVHRDLKPENVLLTASGEVKIADFGLGQLTDASARALLNSGSLRTSEGRDIVGTVRYMAPEQREPGGTIDARADLYAWGILLFEALTGEPPCGAEMPSQVVPGLDPRLDQVFRRCYARRDGRYESAAQALADLDAVLASPAAPTVGPAAPGRAPRAGFLVRAVALAIDALPFCLLGLETESVRYALPLFVLYDGLATGFLGRTAGKWVLGVHAVESSGAPLAPSRAVTRALVRVASLATVAGPVLALGRRKLALHDLVLGTAVEHDGPA